MNDILFFGMQGSGKGTQGELLASKYRYTIFEMGRKLRDIAKENSQLGQQVGAIINRGEMVPDDLVFHIVKLFLLSLRKDEKCIFDGLPRTVPQYYRLKDILTHHTRTYTGVLIVVNQKKAVQRIIARRLCPACKRIFSSALDHPPQCPTCHTTLIQRGDDKDASIIQKRIDTYLKLTHPVTSILRKEGKLTEINGEQEILSVFYELEKKLGEKGEL